MYVCIDACIYGCAFYVCTCAGDGVCICMEACMYEYLSQLVMHLLDVDLYYDSYVKTSHLLI